ncbi:HIRAN domain-containing protein [Sphingomonas sp. NY01]|uniref:HIRAN domain-containing protein n=1 Tax=Sphingomonas sp. NY01 TaxID=2968057 RepID=UPI00315C7B99
MRLEPNNPADKNAVAVYSCRGVQLGYITAERAPWIGAQIRAGRECLAIFQGMTERAGWLRLAFDGAQPTLPIPQTAVDGDYCGADPDSGFYPDPVYDEEM